MISCNIKGPSTSTGKRYYGLGNQLFCIATSTAYAKDHDIRATFPELKDKNKYGSYTENIFRKLDLGKSDQKPIDYIVYNDPNSARHTLIPPPKELLLQSPNGFEKIKKKECDILLNGHFESEKYFLRYRKELLSLFEIPFDIEQQIQEQYKDVVQHPKTVSVHVRRGDFLELQHKHPIQSLEYYKRAFEYFANNSLFVVFSDDIEWCRENFNIVENCVFIGENYDKRSLLAPGTTRDVLDLYLMSKMKNNIIANSTFSWWGAWLNKNSSKIVVAPKNWCGPQTTKEQQQILDKIPANWKKI